ncbi:MAG: geranylgeranyl reductase family protein [Actinomycetota bacterium]|nr:geranylgeranyl reductase family protein [Actinomycetota bacterium]
MGEMHYDVIVVGGGPAGSATAYYLACHGIHVVVMERRAFPRDKVCGDGVAPRAVRDLYQMGLREKIEGNFNKFTGFRFAGAGKRVLESQIPPTPGYPNHGYIIKRRELDTILLEHAREAGAEIWEECLAESPLIENGEVVGVEAKRGNEKIEVTSNMVVGADGAHSAMGRATGLLINNDEHIAVAMRQYFEGVEGIGDLLEIYPEKITSPVSGWIFPVSKTVANVGVWAMRYHLKKYKINLRKSFKMFTEDSTYASVKLKNAHPVSQLEGEILRTGLGGSKIECPGMILVGDAASMVNPVNGEGITYALESGKMAAEHIIGSMKMGGKIHHDPEENSFREKLLKEYGSYFKKGTKSMKWGNKPAFIGLFLAYLARKPEQQEEFIRALMHLRN